MNDIDDFAYAKLIAAADGIATGKGMHDHVTMDFGRRFEIIKVLHDAAAIEGHFADEHVDRVRAAFAKLGRLYPGSRISDCVASLLIPT